MGILIPHKVVAELNARPGQKIHVVIPGKVDWSRVWGRFHAKESTDDLIRNARTERD